MKWNLLTIAIFGAALCTSCEPNEITFFIMEVKAMPEPPSCEYSVSDNFIGAVTVDLALQPSVSNAYLVKNQLLARADYDNLRAESNGILVEGYEVSVNVASTNENVGGTNRFIQEDYIYPQTEDLLLAYTLPGNVSTALAEMYDCSYFNSTNYPVEGLRPSGAIDINRNQVPRALGTAFATVRFFGHTQGQTDVETQDFSFQLNLCCGCSINWQNCIKACDRYCSPADESKMCIAGVPNGTTKIDCRELYYDPLAEWNDDCIDDGTEEERPCNCDDDCS